MNALPKCRRSGDRDAQILNVLICLEIQALWRNRDAKILNVLMPRNTGAVGVVSGAEILNVLICLEMQALWGIVMQRF